MALPQLNIGDVLEVRAYAYCSNQLAVNRHQFTISAFGGSGPVDFDSFSESLLIAMYSPYVTIMSKYAQFLGIGVKKVTTPNPTQEVAYPIAGSFIDGTGLVDSAPLPTQVCGIMRRSGVFVSNGNVCHGRLYLPFPGVSDDNGQGLPSSGYVNNVTVFANNISLPFNIPASGDIAYLVPQINSNQSGPAGDPNITLALGVQRWGTQRKRGSYGKMNYPWP